MNAIASSVRLLHAACLLAGPMLAFRAGRPDAGLSQVKVRNLSGGIAAMHSAWRL